MKSTFFYFKYTVIALFISFNTLFAQQRGLETYIFLSDDEVTSLMESYKDSIVNCCNDDNKQACEIFLKACNLMKGYPELLDAYIPLFCDEHFIGQFLASVSKYNNQLFKKVTDSYYDLVSKVAFEFSLEDWYQLKAQGVVLGIDIDSGFRFWSKLASLCSERALYQEAIYLYSQAINPILAKQFVADIYQSIGDCYYRMDNTLDAVRYYIGAADAFIESHGIDSDTTKAVMLKIYETFDDYVGYNHYQVISIEHLIEDFQRLSYDECSELIDMVLAFFCYISVEYGNESINELQDSIIQNLITQAENENKSFKPTLYQTIGPIGRCYYERMMLHLSNNNLTMFESSLNGFFGHIMDVYDLEYTDKMFVDFTLDISYALEEYGYYDLAKEILSVHSVESTSGCESNEVLFTRYINILIEQNDYYSAIEKLTNAIAIHEDIYGFEHYHTFWDINNLIRQLLHVANIYHLLDRPELDDYLNIIRQLIEQDCVGKNGKPILPEAISGYYFAMGNYSESIEQKIAYYESSLDFYSDGNNDTYKNLPLADLYSESGQYEKSDSLLNTMINSVTFLLLSDHERHLVYNSKLKNSLYKFNEDEAIQYSHALFENVVRDYKRAAKSMVSSELANYWNINYSDLLTTITTAEGRFGNSAELSYDAALFHKGVLLRNMNLRKNNILSSSDTALIRAYERFCYEQRHNTDSVAVAEWEMMYYYSLHPEFTQGDVVPNWHDVKSSLSRNEVAIEFSIMQDLDENAFYYVALVLDQKSSSPRLVRICKQEELKAILSGTKLNNGYSTVYDQYDTKGVNVLYSMIWQPIETYIKSAKTIYFSPVDLLNFVSIENLHKYDGKKSMAELYDVRRVSTTGNINNDSSKDLKTAILYGAIDYNSSISDFTVAEEFSNVNDIYSQMRGHMSRWNYLPNTSIEVSSINNKLALVDVQTITYSGIEGTEESFKILSGSDTDILHLATHGFYFAYDTAARIEYLVKEEGRKTGSSSGIRSGILFSGANKAWLGNQTIDSAEDGILNSDEILGMDLTGTELLVLSACQTGLGDVYNDGIYGIQRSFKIAGVNSIIMSLWEVDDEATQIMMTSFYDFLTQGKNIRESFNLAVKKVRKIYLDKEKQQKRSIPKHKRFDSSYYWTSFVLLD